MHQWVKLSVSVLTVTLLSLISVHSHACGYWLAIDLEHNWRVRFSCGSDNSGFEAKTFLGEHSDEDGLDERKFWSAFWPITAFGAGWGDMTRRRIEDNIIYFDDNEVGRIDGDSFTLYGESYRFIPCADDNVPCSDAPTRMQIVKNDTPVLRSVFCRHCGVQTLNQPLAYVLLKRQYLAEGKARYETDDSEENAKQIFAGLKEGDYRAASAAIANGERSIPAYIAVLRDRKLISWKIENTLWAIAKSNQLSDELRIEIENLFNRKIFWKAKKAAALTLGVLKSKQSLGALGQAMRHKRAGVRSAAIWAVGELGVVDDFVKKRLLKSLRDSDVTVRLAAVKAVGKLKIADEEIRAELKRRVKSDRKQVADAANRVLDGMKARPAETD